MLFEYQNDELVRIEEIPKYFESTTYDVKKTAKGYKLDFEMEGNEHWSEIDTSLLNICGRFEYGNLDILDCMLNLNITNSSFEEKNEEYFGNWPDNDDYFITCKKDECGNITLYCKQSKATLSIIELFELKYTYKE